MSILKRTKKQFKNGHNLLKTNNSKEIVRVSLDILAFKLYTK